MNKITLTWTNANGETQTVSGEGAINFRVDWGDESVYELGNAAPIKVITRPPTTHVEIEFVKMDVPPTIYEDPY